MESREPTSFVEYFSQLDGWFDIKAYPKDNGGIAVYYGTDFGLRTVKQIVEAHDWEIRVTESTDGGARLEITGFEFTGE